jgi:hypothetical protein
MGRCCAPNCNNTHKGGVVMKYIPSNLERQKIWLQKLRRADWDSAPPQKYANCLVCEVSHVEC